MKNGGIQERFGQKFIRFNHPSGIQLEVLEDSADTRKNWTTKEVSGDVATRGFHGPVLSVREIAEQSAFLSMLSVSAKPAKRAPITGSKSEKAAPRRQSPTARTRSPVWQLDLRRGHGASYGARS